MKLLLTSEGFRINKDIFNEMVNLIGKAKNEIKITLFSVKISNLHELYINKDFEFLKSLGINEKNIKHINICEKIPDGVMDNLDVVYMCGGNNYLILDCLRQNGYMKPILDYIQKGGVYVGQSAGSIIMGPNIDICNFEEGDENNVGLKDTSGLNLLDFSIWPHYTDDLHDELLSFKRHYGYRFITLKDTQAILIDGNYIRFIS